MSDIKVGSPMEASKAAASRLLSLPTEVRLKIWFYALQHPQLTAGDFMRQKIVITTGVSQRHLRFALSGNEYWGTERMTRLFRVNRNFMIEWSHVGCICTVSAFICKRSPRFKKLVRRISVCLQIDERHWGPTSFTQGQIQRRQRKQQALYEVLIAELPALRSVSLLVRMDCRPIDDARKAMLVERIVTMASVFRDIEKISLGCRSGNITGMKNEIMQESRERVGRRDWGELPVLKPKFVCCSEKVKEYFE